MADDDDRSAGLTAENKPAPRRRASRSAGPPVEEKTESPAVVADETVDADRTTDSVEVEAESTAVEGAEAAEATPGRRRPTVAMAVAGLLVLALLVAGIVLLIDRNAANDRDAKRNAFVQTARQTVLNLTTIRPETAKEDVERILAGASGDFKAEFDGRQDPFVSVVKEASVTTEGQIIEAGLESEDGDSAKVLVAARANVTTPDQSQSGPRDFRMRVTVTDDGDRMTASKVEFVP
ncbi:hypothetical protein [Rhodococcus sp. NPDC058514]|uniref:hypothetical protein n=1 Tax=unclassified Rhodococcus (in: high G+C Gram-positive bacteria) TaxID=192944 RepID=UPI003669C724